jgi:sulfite reductase beta subunit-like hemoprotein
MALDPQKLRIEGIYEQREPGSFMLRAKVPGGVLSAEQALKAAELAERFAQGKLHLTTRSSLEFHWLRGEDLVQAVRLLAAVGLTSRGACGGAVRGVICSTPFSADFPALQVLARRLHDHFTRNHRFEGLPKKFKIGLAGGYSAESRHLIQDIGLVRGESASDGEHYDIWAAGGLGRAPVPAFLLAERVRPEQLIPLIEGVVTVYKNHAHPGKRLKHLVGEIGRDAFRKLLDEAMEELPTAVIPDGLDKSLTPAPVAGPGGSLEAGVFAGELTAAVFRRLAAVAAEYADGFMVLTADQNLVFLLKDISVRERAAEALREAGFEGTQREERVRFRICPGSHECKVGLAPTRTIARDILADMGPEAETLSWAISGCHNSCAQPQLADAGVIASKLAKDEGDGRTPRFDLYRRSDLSGFGTAVHQELTLEELLEAVKKIG